MQGRCKRCIPAGVAACCVLVFTDAMHFFSTHPIPKQRQQFPRVFAQRVHNDAGIAHRLRLEHAESKERARSAANDAVSSLAVSPESVGALWVAMRQIDRTRSGRLTVMELSAAFDRAGVARSDAQVRWWKDKEPRAWGCAEWP